MKKIMFKAINEGKEYIVNTLSLRDGRIYPGMCFAHHEFGNEKIIKKGECVSFDETTKFMQATTEVVFKEVK